MMISLAGLLVFPFLMAYAGSSDLFTMKISNNISIALVVSFLALALAIGLPWNEIGWHLSCGGAMLVITFTFFALGWVGGGDAKLAAATAVWLGWTDILDYTLVSAILGGILTLGFLQLRKMPLPHWAISHEWIARLHSPQNGVPYGLALSAAGLIVFPSTEIWRRVFGF